MSFERIKLKKRVTLAEGLYQATHEYSVCRLSFYDLRDEPRMGFTHAEQAFDFLRATPIVLIVVSDYMAFDIFL